MEILLRKIVQKGDMLEFKSNSRGGWRFTESLAQPRLTPLQLYLTQIKKNPKIRKKQFATPEYCYVGATIANNYEIAITRRGLQFSADIINDFNSSFTEKNWYWYSKADGQNMAMQMYFTGVRVIANILAYYIELRRTGRIKESVYLYTHTLTSIGLSGVADSIEGGLVTDLDFLYDINLNESRIILSSKDRHSIATASISSFDFNNPYLEPDSNGSINSVDEDGDSDSAKQAYQGSIDRVEETQNHNRNLETDDVNSTTKSENNDNNRLVVPKLIRKPLEDSDSQYALSNEDAKRNKHRVKLPKINTNN